MASPARFLAASLGAAVLLLAASAGPLYGAAVPTSGTVAVAQGQGGLCVPDLSPDVVAAANSGGNPDPSLARNPVTAEQVRLGTVPPPPFGRLLASGGVALQPASAAGRAGESAATTAVEVYETSCAPVDVQEFYLAVLRQNQWSGDFTPAGGAAGQTTRPAPPGATILFDLDSMVSGHFLNTNPTAEVVAGITVVAAIVSPGSGPDEQHPTYVQIVARRSPRPDAPRTLAPPVSTTPNVGASGGP